MLILIEHISPFGFPGLHFSAANKLMNTPHAKPAILPTRFLIFTVLTNAKLQRLTNGQNRHPAMTIVQNSVLARPVTVDQSTLDRSTLDLVLPGMRMVARERVAILAACMNRLKPKVLKAAPTV